MEEIDKYLKMTGQTFQYLMGGANAFGFEFIHDLVKKCIKENKKIIWKDIPDTLDAMDYKLKEIKIKKK